MITKSSAKCDLCTKNNIIPIIILQNYTLLLNIQMKFKHWCHNNHQHADKKPAR